MNFYTLDALVYVLVFALSFRIWKHIRHPLYKFPGPRLAAWTNIPYSYWFVSGRQPFWILSLHEKYGPVVRVAPNELSFNSEASWRDIYGYRPGHKSFIKGDFYDGAAFVDRVRSIVNVKDPAEHGRMRRHLAHAFSESSLRQQEGLISEVVDLLIQKLGDYGDSENGTDLQRWLNMATFDLTGSLAFGETFGALQNGGTHPSVAFILKALRFLAVVDTLRRFPWLELVCKVLMPKMVKKLEDDHKAHEEHVLNVIRRRLKTCSDRPDFLTRMIERGEKNDVTEIQLAAHAADILTAGSDSTNTAISTAFYYTLRNPEIMGQMQSEIRSSFNSYSEINSLSTQNLRFTRAVILEALRIFPPLPLGLPRVVPDGGDVVDGQFIPAGTLVSTNPFAACLSPSNFHRPWEFRPERWLGENKEDVMGASQPFSLGTRACIGQNLAWIEMKTIIAKIIYSYDMELVNRDMDWHRDSRMHTLWSKPELIVRVEARKIEQQLQNTSQDCVEETRKIATFSIHQ